MWRLPVHWNTVWCRKLWAATSCGWRLEVNYIFVGGVSGVVLTAATWRQLNNNETNKNISYLCAARLGVGKCIHFCTLFHLIIGQQRMLRATGASPLARRASHVLPVRWCDAGSIKSHDKLRTTDRRELLVASIMEHCKVDRSISHYAKRLKSCVLYVSFFFLLPNNIPQGKKKKVPGCQHVCSVVAKSGGAKRRSRDEYDWHHGAGRQDTYFPELKNLVVCFVKASCRPFLFLLFLFLDCISRSFSSWIQSLENGVENGG